MTWWHVTLQCSCCVTRWHVIWLTGDMSDDINRMMFHLYFAMYLLCQQVTCHMTLAGWCVTCTLLCSAVVVLTGDMSYDEDRMMCHLYTLGVVALLCPSVTPKRTPMLVQSFIATPCISAAGADLWQFVHLTFSTFLFPPYFIILDALPSSFTNEKGERNMQKEQKKLFVLFVNFRSKCREKNKQVVNCWGIIFRSGTP